MRKPFMKMYWSEFFDDPRVQALPPVTRAVYAMLLGAMWVNEGWLPADEKKLARMLDLDVRAWRPFAKAILPLLSESYDEIIGMYLTQKRLRIEWDKAADLREIRTANLGAFAQAKPRKTRKHRHQAGAQKPQPSRSTNQATEQENHAGNLGADITRAREKNSALQAESSSHGTMAQDGVLPPREIEPSPDEAQPAQRSDLTKRLVSDGLKRPSLSDIANMGKR